MKRRHAAVGKAFELIIWSVTWQVRFYMFAVFMIDAVQGQIRYSIPEEMKRGVFVGDVAKDLGLDINRLSSGQARLLSDSDRQHIELNRDKGHLVVKERMDREQLCGQKSPCSFSLELVLENPLELYAITVEVEDINDNAPAFSEKEIRLDISESAPVGTHFLLGSATDPDVGPNSLQSYLLKPANSFALKQHSRPDGSKYAEMVLQTPLDREEKSEHILKLTAVDGGTPQMSGTVQIHVTVLDANDNAPVFEEALYRASLMENAPEGTLVGRVKATDADEGFNSNITYILTHVDDSVRHTFQLNSNTGEIRLKGETDHEKRRQYEINIQAKDPWGLTGSSKLVVEILDMNDNTPVITMTSFSGKIPEDSKPGTTVALISVQDPDSGKNGQVHVSIGENLPFKIKSSLRNYHTLVTDATLDRENTSNYSITITATDEGSPSLSTKKSVVLEITDVNDNSPTFDQSAYKTQISENNSPGVSVFTVRASDPDSGQNARVSYYLIDSEVNGVPVTTYFSLNSESGIIYSVGSLDFEKVKEFEVHIKAQDGGSPPLSSNATVNIYVQDQNDNAPQVLYPVQPGGSQVPEMVPRSADVGYLVTKVVAVDVDSGQNAWLSYKLLKTTERGLFDVGLQNGEIRTVRQVSDKDPVKQKLTVVVEDNGQPSRSATVHVNVVVSDNFPEVLSEFSDFTHETESKGNLTFYLVLALAVVSFLFISSLIIIVSVKMYRWRQSRIYYQSNLPVIPYYPPCYADPGGTGTLPHLYNYEVCMTTDSRKSDFNITRPAESLLGDDVSITKAMPNQNTYHEEKDAKVSLGDNVTKKK